MTDLISIGGSSIRNSQMALSVVSNNIANVNTEGYVRQDLALQEGLPTKNGLFFWAVALLLTVFVVLMTVKLNLRCESASVISMPSRR